MNLSEFPPGGWTFEDVDGWTLQVAHMDFGAAANAIVLHRLASAALRARAGIVECRRDLLEFTARRLPGRYGDSPNRERLVVASMPRSGGGCGGCG